jgi:RNA polymerase sigma-70 factor (ECF subfamily)
MGRDFDSFCRQEYSSVYWAAFALSSNREVAEDATQEAFGRAYARWPRLQKEPWVAGWVMTTALNLCRTTARKGRRLVLDEPTVLPLPAPNANRIDVIAALRRLPPRQQQAVILYYIGDLPIRAVAELMDMSDGTVKSYLFRARSSLRDLLAEHDSSRKESETHNG